MVSSTGPSRRLRHRWLTSLSTTTTTVDRPWHLQMLSNTFILLISLCMMMPSHMNVSASSSDDKLNVTIGGIWSLSGNFSEPTVRGGVLTAISELNSASDSRVRYQLITRNHKDNKLGAFNYALQFAGIRPTRDIDSSLLVNATGDVSNLDTTTDDDDDLNNTLIDLDLPIVFGASQSSITEHINGVFSSFALINIGSSTTSANLEDRDVFPNFNRVAPSNSLQAIAIVELAKNREWNRLGILYTQDAYGSSLAFSILRTANEQTPTIETSSFSFRTGDNESALVAARSLRTAKEFIIVLIMFDTDIDIVFDALTANDMNRYPYYYIGVDAWFDLNVIAADDGGTENVSQFKGLIGTVPYRPAESNIRDTVDELWQATYLSGETANFSLPGIWGYYGYDAMRLVDVAVNRFIDRYGIMELNRTYRNTDPNSTFYGKPKTYFETILGLIRSNETQFNGSTGPVSILSNGERKNGIFAFANIQENNTFEIVATVGLVGTNTNDTESDFSIIENGGLVLPDDFKEDPKSEPDEVAIKQTISEGAFAAACTLTGLFFTVTVFYFGSLQYWRYRQIIKASSRRLNQICCAGAALYFVTAWMFGLDERVIKNKGSMVFLCNFRLSTMMLASTLFFGPLILKTYRIYKIFIFVQKTLKEVDLNDFKLIKWIGYVCVSDIMICLIFLGFLCPLSRVKQQGNERERIDSDFEIRTPEWYICEMDGKPWQGVLFTCVLCWFCITKGCCLLYGVYLGFNVWSIERKSYNEAINVLSSLFLNTATLCACILIENVLTASNKNTGSATVISLKYLLVFMSTSFTVFAGLSAIIVPKLRYIFVMADDDGSGKSIATREKIIIESTVISLLQTMIDEKQKMFEKSVAGGEGGAGVGAGPANRNLIKTPSTFIVSDKKHSYNIGSRIDPAMSQTVADSHSDPSSRIVSITERPTVLSSVRPEAVSSSASGSGSQSHTGGAIMSGTGAPITPVGGQHSSDPILVDSVPHRKRTAFGVLAGIASRRDTTISQAGGGGSSDTLSEHGDYEPPRTTSVARDHRLSTADMVRNRRLRMDQSLSVAMPTYSDIAAIAKGRMTMQDAAAFLRDGGSQRSIARGIDGSSGTGVGRLTAAPEAYEVTSMSRPEPPMHE